MSAPHSGDADRETESPARELARLLGDREISLGDLSDEWWARLQGDPEFMRAFEVAIERSKMKVAP